jgi:hypothetical protein
MSGDNLPAVAHPAPATSVTLALEERQLGLLERQAGMVARSSLAPPALRGKPADVLLVGMTGRDLGLGLPTALQQIDVISGRPVLSARLCGAKATQSGAVWWFEESSSERCTVAGHRRGQPTRVQRITWTIEDAKRANLASKDVWKQHPAAMLRARAVKAWVMAVCPEALLGLDMSATPAEEALDDYDDDSAVVEQVSIPAAPAVDEIRDAEVVVEPAPTDEAWPKRWMALCAQHGVNAATSKQILTDLAGVKASADVPPQARMAAEQMLADYVAQRDGEPDR